MTTSTSVPSEIRSQLRTAGVELPDAELDEFASVAADRPDGAPTISIRERAGKIVVYVVNDDMPMIVEAVLAASRDAGVRVESVEHPVVSVQRGPGGELLGIGPRAGADDESWICLSARVRTGDDGDAAGVKAALRGLDIVLEQGLNVKLVLLPDSEDPDSFVKKNGTDATLDFIQKKQQDFILFKATQGIEEVKNDPVKKAEVIKDIVESIAKVDDNIKRQLYIKHCADIVEVPENILVNETNKIRTQQFKKSKEFNQEDATAINEYVKTDVDHSQPEVSKTPPLYHQEKDIIRVLLEHGDQEMNEKESVAEHIIFELVDVEFKTEVFGKIIKLYMDAYTDETPLEEVKNLNNIRENDVKDCLVELMSSPYELSPNWFAKHEIVVKDANRTYKTDVVSVMQRFRYFKMMEAIKILDEKIKIADQSGNFEEMIASIMKKMELMEVRKQLAKEIQTVIHPH